MLAKRNTKSKSDSSPCGVKEAVRGVGGVGRSGGLGLVVRGATGSLAVAPTLVGCLGGRAGYALGKLSAPQGEGL